ncbi:MAG: hypothetical protein LC099_04590 [Anaerolineales bacterium]|nr:hypothetical protein [Anaerolineales bacterium]
MKRPLIVLLFVATLAYGLLVPQLGFYWDDLPMSWIRYQLGAEAMTRYFSTNRPIWALLYQITTRLLPHKPLYWQLFALFWRWLGAATLWALAKRLFPQRAQFALTLSLLFLLYPAFNQQWTSYLYSHFFIVLFFFLFSIYWTLRGKTLPALIFSALNLWMMEYFFVLELIRPFIIWAALPADTPLKPALRTTFKRWIPYLALFALAVFSRVFIFNNQIYQFSLKAELTQAPLATLFLLAKNVLSSLWTTTLAAWGLVFQFPTLAADGPRTIAIYLAVMLLVGAAVWFFRSPSAEDEKRPLVKRALIIGAAALLLGGPPFWLTNVPVSLGFPANRATLSFMLGASFLLAGLLELLPTKFKYALTVLLVALAAGRQFLWANDFRRDWANQKNMFWQMVWRASALEKDTTILINEQLKYYADNSLSPVVNWIYAPDNHSDVWNYILFYPTNRETLRLTPNAPIDYDFLAGEFHGNTSRTVVFYYAPPRCLRLLDPEIDSINRLIPAETLLREAATLSSSAPILDEPAARMPDIYQPEPARGWCYYFQKADLARQERNWQTVVQLGETAFALNDYPNDPVERFVFIEGYAHQADWEKAVKLSEETHRISKEYLSPLLCRLWNRIERETKSSAEKTSALEIVRSEFECSP